MAPPPREHEDAAASLDVYMAVAFADGVVARSADWTLLGSLAGSGGMVGLRREEAGRGWPEPGA